MMMRLTMRRIAFLAGVAACALTAGLAAGQAYPTKPIRLIAPYPPGGSSDILARILARLYRRRDFPSALISSL